MLCVGQTAPCSLPHGVSVCDDSSERTRVCARTCVQAGLVPPAQEPSQKPQKLQTWVEGFRTEAAHPKLLLLPCPQGTTQASA